MGAGKGRGKGRGGCGDEDCVPCVLILVGIVTAISVFLLAFSFDIVTPLERGVLYDNIHKHIATTTTGEGRHFVVLGRGFVKYPYKLSSIDFSGAAGKGDSLIEVKRGDSLSSDNYGPNLRCWSKEGQLMSLDVSVLYRLDPKTLHSIYMNFGEDHVNYRKHFAHLMYSVIKQTSTKFLAIEYFSKRKEIRATMKSDLTRAFGQWGATVEAVQLRKVTIPRKFENIVVNKVVENQEAVYQTQNQKYISVLYDTKIIQAQAAGDVAYIINEAKATGDMTLAKRSAEALKIFQDNAVESRTALAKHLGLETKEQMLYYIWTKLLKSERMNGGTKSLAIGVGKRSGGQKFQQVMRPEVQEIRTLADYSNEVKQIVVSGADVHIITTSCYSGTTIGGEFRMTIGNSTTSTHLYHTNVPVAATAAEMKRYIEDTTPFTVSVTRQDATGCAGAATWRVTFTNTGGSSQPYPIQRNGFPIKINATSLTGTAPTATATRPFLDSSCTNAASTSDCLGGTFTVTFGGQTTSALPFNVSATAMDAALEELSSITKVDVTRGPTDGVGGHVYNITFVTPRGPIANQFTSSASLTGQAAAIEHKLVETGNVIGAGTKFYVTFGSKNTSNTFPNGIVNGASAADVKAQIESLVSTGEVDVSREGPDSVNGYRWFVTFLTNQGNVPTMGVHTINPSGEGTRTTVTEVRRGTGPSNMVYSFP